MLRCGKSDVYIKPECVCSFHHVYDASKYHSYSSCPQGDELDVVTQLKCDRWFNFIKFQNASILNLAYWVHTYGFHLHFTYNLQTMHALVAFCI